MLGGARFPRNGHCLRASCGRGIPLPRGLLALAAFCFSTYCARVGGSDHHQWHIFCLVLSPLFSNAQRTPIFSLSVAGLLLANGALHVIATLATRRYSPGTVTSVFCYFPTSIYSLLTIAPKWHMGVPEVIGAISLGVLWQLLPLGVMARHSWR